MIWNKHNSTAALFKIKLLMIKNAFAEDKIINKCTHAVRIKNYRHISNW